MHEKKVNLFDFTLCLKNKRKISYCFGFVRLGGKRHFLAVGYLEDKQTTEI